MAAFLEALAAPYPHLGAGNRTRSRKLKEFEVQNIAYDLFSNLELLPIPLKQFRMAAKYLWQQNGLHTKRPGTL